MHGAWRCWPAVPRGLPKLVLPDLTALPFTKALVATLPVAAVILAETLLASSGTAQKNGYRLNGRREIAAYAVCNVAAGLVGCCVVSGSVSRTAVNERNGGKTQLVSVTASVTMLLVLLFATPLIRFLPVPVLTAIVVNALIGATEFGIARRLWRVNRVELGIFAGAFLGVLLLGAIKGVLVGMVLSFVDVLMRAAAPQRTFLGTLPGKSGFFPIDRVSGVQPLPHIVLYRFSGSLFFANIRRFQEDIEGALPARHAGRHRRRQRRRERGHHRLRPARRAQPQAARAGRALLSDRAHRRGQRPAAPL